MTGPRFRSLQFYVTAEVFRGLEAMAAEAGKTVQETADELLTALVEDDQAAHGEDREQAA